MFIMCPSDGLRVDGIVLLMRTDEADIQYSVGIVDPCYETILVSCNIEDNTPVLENACRRDVQFDVRRRCPIGGFCLSVPRHQRITRVLVARTTTVYIINSHDGVEPLTHTI